MDIRQSETKSREVRLKWTKVATYRYTIYTVRIANVDRYLQCNGLNIGKMDFGVKSRWYRGCEVERESSDHCCQRKNCASANSHPAIESNHSERVQIVTLRHVNNYLKIFFL